MTWGLYLVTNKSYICCLTIPSKLSYFVFEALPYYGFYALFRYIG